MATQTDPRAKAIADSLPVSDDTTDPNRPDLTGDDPERIPLQDIVITGIEHSEFTHFRVRKYDPDADGFEHEWAIIESLPAGLRDGERHHGVMLNASTVRYGVARYLTDRLGRGMPEDEARKMVDGVYTDVLVCDSILQFILYGEEVFG